MHQPLNSATGPFRDHNPQDSPLHDSVLQLIATILGGGRSGPAAELRTRRLIRYFGCAEGLTFASVEEIRREGRTTASQALTLKAALSLGRTLCSSPFRPREKFSTSRDLFQRYRACFFAAVREHFLSLQLNSKNQLMREVVISIGSLNSSMVHPREVFSPAVRDSAAAVIFLHNHPSGDPTPSREDRECTVRLCRAGKILGIRILDHIVIGHDDYFSFADAGLLDGPD